MQCRLQTADWSSEVAVQPPQESVVSWLSFHLSLPSKAYSHFPILTVQTLYTHPLHISDTITVLVADGEAVFHHPQAVRSARLNRCLFFLLRFRPHPPPTTTHYHPPLHHINNIIHSHPSFPSIFPCYSLNILNNGSTLRTSATSSHIWHHLALSHSHAHTLTQTRPSRLSLLLLLYMGPCHYWPYQVYQKIGPV